MNLPYVIDNREHILADVLNRLLCHADVHALDVATAYFNIGGFELLQEGLEGLDSFRLLLGAEPGSGDDIGLQVRRDLDAAPFDEETLHLVETLIRYLRKETVFVRLYELGFLHAKAYLAFADRAPGDRFTPVAGIVGSSNFTRAGLTSNQELNLTHKTVINPAEADDPAASAAVRPLLRADGTPQSASPSLEGSLDSPTRRAVKSEVGARAILELLDWYDVRWAESQSYKDELIALLNESKFGDFEYTPYHIYLKTLYEYFKDELGEEGLQPAGTRSAVELTEFQGDAVKKARRILARYDGVMIADSVGLGKTWIGKKLLEDHAYHRRQKALVICPASLREMWKKELSEATIPAQVISQEILGRDDFDTRRYHDVDVILIDESHNFRNHLSNRYDKLGRLIGANGGLGRDGERKRLILLTATPINNTIFDLYNQIMLFAQGDRTYFSAAGIGDLRKFFLKPRRQADISGGNQMMAIFNLLEEVVVRRTRSFIRNTYPEATIGGETIHWPERALRTIRYNLAETYTGLYDDIVAGIESLRLSPYSLEDYKHRGVDKNEMDLGREQALVGIFKSRYLKRFESSVHAFRISVHRALEFQQTFLSLLDEGRLLDSSSFREAVRYLDREGEDDNTAPISRAEGLNARDEARDVLDSLPVLNAALYDLPRLRAAVQHDIATLTKIWERITEITPKRDAKLERLKALLRGELKGEKVLLFTYYKDTAQYLYDQLVNDDDFLAAAGQPRLARMDGGIAPSDRGGRIARFAPVANDRPKLAGSEAEIDVMVSTDVLSEGQNLQDCGYLLNYD
ncbi:MAG: helicase-related protein, partial [Chloroflexota bacterium]|nr:helicase-related protein [Chloroflexota bacterium]